MKSCYSEFFVRSPTSFHVEFDLPPREAVLLSTHVIDRWGAGTFRSGVILLNSESAELSSRGARYRLRQAGLGRIRCCGSLDVGGLTFFVSNLRFLTAQGVKSMIDRGHLSPIEESLKCGVELGDGCGAGELTAICCDAKICLCE